MYFLSVLFTPTIAGISRDKIYVYVGEGTSTDSINHFLFSMKEVVSPGYTLVKTEASDVIKGDIFEDAALFVLPGGRDLPYVASLSPQGIINIQQYVKTGGKYLGICAGAYFASKSIRFEEGTPQEIISPRELSFFPDTAIGSVLAPYVYNSEIGARAASIYAHNNEILKVYFNGGCYFMNASIYPNVQNMFYYMIDGRKSNKPAIISIKYGKGIALLSGVHFEYAPGLMKEKPIMPEIGNEIKKTELQRRKLLISILQKLGLEINENNEDRFKNK